MQHGHGTRLNAGPQFFIRWNQIPKRLLKTDGAYDRDRTPVILNPEVKKSRFVGRSGSGVFRSGGGSKRR